MNFILFGLNNHPKGLLGHMPIIPGNTQNGDMAAGTSHCSQADPEGPEENSMKARGEGMGRGW